MGFKTIGELQAKITGLSTLGMKLPKRKTNPNPNPGRKGCKKGKLEDYKNKEYAKYVYVTVRYASTKGFYFKQNRVMRRRTYCIGILTGNNKLNYIEYNISTCHITSSQLNKLKKLLLNKYRYDINTEVVFDKQIDDHDMMFLMFSIMRTICLFSINKTDITTMCKTVNKAFSLIKKSMLRGREGFGENRIKCMIESAHKKGYLEFVGQEIFDLLGSRTGERRAKIRYCILAMLYIYQKIYVRKNGEKFRERQKEKKQP